MQQILTTRTTLIRISLSLIILLSAIISFAQVIPIEPPVHFKPEAIKPYVKKSTFIYATQDSLQLKLDIYTNDSLKNDTTKKPCMIFVFGGAFIAGKRDAPIYNGYFNSLAMHNYITVSISYRLGLKGVKNISPLNTAPLRKAIQMAVDDLYDATDWLIMHADSLHIDTSKIILSGSSAGAITILQADFERANKLCPAEKLPPDFKYAGVLAYSGAILSYEGKFKYKTTPAPVMLFYGTGDKIVPYNKIRLFNRGMYGSSWIARTYKKENHPYYIYRAQDLGHEMSVLPMIDQLPRIYDFLDQFVIQKKQLQVDIWYKDPSIKPILTISPKVLFKRLSHKK